MGGPLRAALKRRNGIIGAAIRPDGGTALAGRGAAREIPPLDHPAMTPFSEFIFLFYG
jgi:hypothetical protein